MASFEATGPEAFKVLLIGTFGYTQVGDSGRPWGDFALPLDKLATQNP